MTAKLPRDDAENKLPQREGTYGIDLPGKAEPPRIVPVETLLSSMTSEHVFFHHGLFFAIGALEQDPLPRAWEQAGLPAVDRPGMYTGPTRFFRGLPLRAAKWERTLGIVHRDFWPFVQSTLRATTNVAWKTRRIWSAAELLIDVPDPLYHFANPTANHCPRVPVVVFTVNGNWATYGLRPCRMDHYTDYTDEVPDYYYLVTGPPCPNVTRIGERLFTEESHTPFRATEPTSFTDVFPPVILPDNI